MTDFEIINKADLKYKYGTGADVIDALSRCRSLFSRVEKEWNDSNKDEQDYFLVKEFESHLKIVQYLCIHAENQRFTSASKAKGRKASTLSATIKSNDQPYEKIPKISDITSLHVIDCNTSPEKTSKTHQHQSSRIIKVGFEWDPRAHSSDRSCKTLESSNLDYTSASKERVSDVFKLSSRPESNDHPCEKNPKINSDNTNLRVVTNHSDSLKNKVETQRHQNCQGVSSSQKSRIEHRWDQRYKELLSFIENHGHARVSRRPPQYTSLGNWVMHQRQHYKKYRSGKPSFMTENQILLLNKIGFEWDCSSKPWKKTYDELVTFVKENGHARVPQNYPQNRRLGVWVTTQRTCYKQRQKGDSSSTMTENRIELLNKIGFEWAIIRASK